MFDAASHRDFLGACLNTGIQRRLVGDILVLRDAGAQILCTPEMADYLEMSLTQVCKMLSPH
jgi:RNA-binding protein YlmH